MPLTPLPYNLPGAVFGSPMPFGPFDTGDTLDLYKKHGVEVVVALAEAGEMRRLAGRDLLALYRRQGFDVLHHPIPDFGAPPDGAAFEAAVAEALDQARAGRALAVHCNAGVGRTGLFAAALAQEALGLTAEAALAWVRERIPGAVESREQVAFLQARGNA